MKLSACTAVICISMVSAQRNLQGVADIGEIVSSEGTIAGTSGYSYDENGQIVAPLTEEEPVAEATTKLPVEDAIIVEPEFPLLVEVDSAITNVFFQLDNPSGVTSDWMEGEHETDSRIFSLSLSSYLGTGEYTWRFKTVDSSREELVSVDSSFFVDQESTPFGILRSRIADQIENDSSLAEHYKTLSVQDCAFRCDGCVDLVHEDPYGLSDVIDTLQEIWKDAAQEGISRADVFTLAGLVGAEMSAANQRNQEEFPMEWSGRINCEKIIPYCVAVDGGQIHCGPKAAPDYGDSDGMGSLAVSAMDISTLDEATLLNVIESGDSALNLVPCPDPGPCYVQA